MINQQRDLLVSMLQGLARLGDVGTRIINQSATDTVADLQLLQPILTQLAAAGPDLAGSLDLLLTYPFPASSVIGSPKQRRPHAAELPAGRADRGIRPVHEHDRRRCELDLTQTLCRYAIDPASGALKILQPVSCRAAACGQPGTPPGNRSSSGSGSSRGRGGTANPVGLPGNVVGQVPVPERQTGSLAGLPQIPGVTK